MSLVGLVGCGRWGKLILRDLRALGCRVIVVARSEESRENARAGGAEAIVATPRELADVAGAIVASPSSTHAAVVLELLPRGVPIFVEKPLSVDPASAERIAALAPGRVFVMDKWRYHPGVVALRELARSGELGAVTGLRLRRIERETAHRDVDAIWTLLPHDLAIALEVLGSIPEPTGAVLDPAGPSLVGLAQGEPWLAVEVGAGRLVRAREVSLHGRDGAAVITDAWEDAITIVRRGVADERRAVGAELPLLAELRAFVQHLEGGPPPRSSAAEGALVVRRVARFRELAQPGAM